MKLKLYRILLLTCLFALASLVIFFIVNTIVYFKTIENSTDGVMYIVSLFVLLAFLGLEIGNTFVSFKNGSTFAKAIAYNQDYSFNLTGVIIMSVAGFASLAGAIYTLLLILGLKLPLSTFDKQLLYVVFGTLMTMVVNSLFVLLFPLLGKEDTSMKKKDSSRE